ncbi:MAG: hypothetical protein QW050_00575 [Candidatus Nitrosocaldaceae archaeon]
MIELLIMLFIIDSSIDEHIEQAIISIKSAEEFGADTSSLVDRLKQTINVIEECKEGIENSKIELNSIIDDAKALREDAINSRNLSTAYSYILSVIIAVIISVIVVYTYNKWKLIEHKRFMSMRIKEREEE